MDDLGGVWRTIGGRRVFIKNGQDLATAMKESKKFDKERSQNQKHKNKNIKKEENNAETKEIQNLKSRLDELNKEMEGKTFLEKVKYMEEYNSIVGKINEIEEKEIKLKAQEKIKKYKEELAKDKVKLEKIKQEQHEQEKKYLDSIQKDLTHKKLQDKSNELYKKLSKEELKSIDDYTLEEYRSINDELKHDNLSVENKKRVRDIDNIIKKFSNEDDGPFYRGVPLEEVKKLKIGEEYSPNYYQSSSYHEKVATIYANNYGKSHGAMIIYKGKLDGAFIGTNSSTFITEGEFLISRHQKTIVKNIYVKDGITIYEMEVKK